MSTSLLQASTASVSRTRSPSPALPGAWPPTPLHARSFTYPTLQSIPDNYVPGFDTSTTSPPLPDTRNLDHVLNFHKRLSQALASPLESAKLFPSSSSVPGLTEGVASSSRSVPSDDSDLTKYTTNENTLSMSRDMSLNTSYTGYSPERLGFTKLPRFAKGPSSEASAGSHTVQETRIHQLPSPALSQNSSTGPSPQPYSRQRRSIPGQGLDCNDVFSDGQASSPSQSHRSQRPLLAVSTPNSMTSSPTRSSPTSADSPTLSPIVFRSPTSSNRLPFAAAFGEQSFQDDSSSPSWLTSYGSDYDDSDMLRSPSPSPSPLSARREMRRRGLSLSGRHPEDLAPSSPSIPDIASPSVPMLTNLSLPGTPVDDSVYLEAPDNPVRAPAASQDAPWTLSLPSAEEPYSFLSLAPTSPRSLSLSLSLTSSSFGALLDTGGNEHLLRFPSPAFTPSSELSSPAFSPGPGPDQFVGPDVRETSATGAEYATAVMSSAWTADGPHIEPILIEMRDSPAVQDDQTESFVHCSDIDFPSEGAHLGHSVPADSIHGASRLGKPGLFRKVKHLGVKVKSLLRRKARRDRKEILEVDVDVSTIAQEDDDMLLHHGVPSPSEVELPEIEQILESLPHLDLSSIGLDNHIPLPLAIPPPPGLNQRTRRVRPVLTAQTYTSGTGSSLLQAPSNGNSTRTSVLQVSSANASTISHVSNPGVTPICSLDLAHAEPTPRPASAAKKESTRRFSLSALTNLTRLHRHPSAAISVSASSNRPRPLSALPFTSTRGRVFYLDAENFNPATLMDSPASDVHRSNVPRTRLSSRLETTSARRPRPSVTIAAPTPVSTPDTLAISTLPTEETEERRRSSGPNQARRYSFSALSNFIPGLL